MATLRSKKRKNLIKITDSMELLQGQGLNPQIFNFYQIRIKQEETTDFWDWYHTTGSVVMNDKGHHRKIGDYVDAESLAIRILKDIYK